MCTPHVQSKCYLKAVRIEGTSDVEDLVSKVYVYDRCILSVANMVMEVQGRKSEALKVSVSNNGELFYRQKCNTRARQVLVVSAH